MSDSGRASFKFFLLFTQCQSLMQCVKLSISIFFFFFCHELTSCDIVLKGLNIFNLLLTHDFVLKQYDMF
jgi:hypothetical protein